jgi:hypothetical protein
MWLHPTKAYVIAPVESGYFMEKKMGIVLQNMQKKQNLEK